MKRTTLLVMLALLIGGVLAAGPAAAETVPDPISDRQTSDLADRVTKLLGLEKGTSVGVPGNGVKLPDLLKIRQLDDARQACSLLEGKKDAPNAVAQLCQGVTSRPSGGVASTVGGMFANARKNPLNVLNPDNSMCTGGSVRVPPWVIASQDRQSVPTKNIDRTNPPKDGHDDWECGGVGTDGSCTRVLTGTTEDGHDSSIIQTYNGSTGEFTEQVTDQIGPNHTHMEAYIFHADGTEDRITREYRSGRVLWERSDTVDEQDPDLHHVKEYRRGRLVNHHDYRASEQSGQAGRPPLTEELGVEDGTGIPLANLERNTCTDAQRAWNNLINLVYEGDGSCPSPVENDPAAQDNGAAPPATEEADCYLYDPPEDTGGKQDPTNPGGPGGLGDGNGLGGRALLPPLNIPYLPDFFGGGCLGPAGDCAN